MKLWSLLKLLGIVKRVLLDRGMHQKAFEVLETGFLPHCCNLAFLILTLYPFLPGAILSLEKMPLLSCEATPEECLSPMAWKAALG